MISLHLVLERVTGRGLEALVRRGITEPLRMHDTAYRPPAAWRPRIAATSFKTRPARGLLRGSVHDDNAWALGGVAGHAGLFSTVDDLAVLAQTLLNGGTYRGRRILAPTAVTLLGRNYTSRFPGDAHGLGFELDQAWYMGALSSPRTLGHTGFTGTSLVIDPLSRSFAILLTNRVHPRDETPSINPARRALARALARSLPVRAPGGGPSWFAGPPDGPRRGLREAGGRNGFPGTESTLTTGPLRLPAPDRVTRPPDGTARPYGGRRPLRVRYDAFVDLDETDRFVMEYSTDGGRTWRAVPGTARSGYHGRRWQRVHARLPAGPYPAGLRLRWRYTTTGVSGGRGVNLAGVRVTDATRVLFDGGCSATRPAAHGWRPLPPPRPPAYASGLVPGGTALGCPREALPGTIHRPRRGTAPSRL